MSFGDAVHSTVQFSTVRSGEGGELALILFLLSLIQVPVPIFPTGTTSTIFIGRNGSSTVPYCTVAKTSTSFYLSLSF